MKIGILTTFSSWAESYSLVHVVDSQISMLKKAGYDPVLFVSTNFYGNHPDCEIRKIVPIYIYENYTTVASIPNELTMSIKSALEENMQDIDICFTHDILLQDFFLAHNLAVRLVNLPILWYHWLHSQPTGVKISNINDGHKIVFLNYTDRLAVAERFTTWTDNVEIVYNSIEPHTYVGDETTKLCSKILEHKDIKIAYPFCTTRMGAKGVAKLLRLAGKIKKEKKSVGVCLLNSNANCEREKKSIEAMKNIAYSYGLDDEDFVFTSIIAPHLECGVPHHVVRDIFSLTNLFIFPSTTESCSLVLLEAMSGGNRLVLNDDVPSMKEMGGFKDAIYMKFGSNWLETKYNDEDKYYQDYAKIILRRMKEPFMEDRRNLFSEENIWETQLKRLVSLSSCSTVKDASCQELTQ
jgi:hypothetical protein